MVKTLALKNKHLLTIKTVKYCKQPVSWASQQCLFHLSSHIFNCRAQKADTNSCDIATSKDTER